MTSIWTIGHSNLSLEDFIYTLKSFDIECIADVRRFPGSRKYPHLGKDALTESLRESGITYMHIEELGGRRRPATPSVNDGWKNSSFRGYADHMSTEEFAEGIIRLVNTASLVRTACMCSEVLWWRCHRRLIADYLFVRGWDVVHIFNATKSVKHSITPPAKIVAGNLSYSAVPT